MAKLGPDAFDYYFSLGPSRSYELVGAKYGVTKRAVTKLASKENWQSRVAELETKARKATDDKNVETLEAMNTRHLKALRIIQGRALETLRTMSLKNAMEAVRALDIAIKQERVVCGEPSERTAVSVEEQIKGEYERWMTVSSDAERSDDDTHGKAQ